MKFGVVMFPGSNCDMDCLNVVRNVLKKPVDALWHGDDHADLSGYDVILLPGGFSYGDYLRTGAIARFSPIMGAIRDYIEANKGLVVGICNGFQILCESGLLPGALVRNTSMKFICDDVNLRVETKNSALTRRLKKGTRLTIPIAHGEGNYRADAVILRDLERSDQILLRYVDSRGRPTAQGNPNGSMGNIAGIMNKQRTVFGMMPHPERASESELGNSDGLALLKTLTLGN